MSVIADLAWIKRGVPRAVPDKVKLTTGEIQDLIRSGEMKTTELFGANTEANERTGNLCDPCLHILDKGSKTDRCKKRHYDGNNSGSFNYLAGLSAFDTQVKDPRIAMHVDSDEEEREDFEIKPDDNLVAVAKVNKNEYILEIYLYNKAESDWYVHHDYILEAPPLCLEAISFDPGSEDKKGNLLAVGDMDAEICIWDLDIVNAVEPVCSLGWARTAKKKQRRDGNSQVHTDAVLSMAWNHLTEHVLASGSADRSVILWDLEEAKPATVGTHFDGKVKAVKWHPGEFAILLAGTLSSQVGICDCREFNGLSRQWKVVGEVEQLTWDYFNPFYFFVVTNDGYLGYIDVRKNEPVFLKKIHKGGARSVTQSFYTKGLLSTCGGDGLIKIWHLRESNNRSRILDLVAAKNLNLGALHVCHFSPDDGTILAVGGEQEEMVKIVDVYKFKKVQIACS